MKVYLDVEAAMVERYEAAGRAVVGLEWVAAREDAEALITDKAVKSEPSRSSLFVGDVFQLVTVFPATTDIETGLLLGCPWRHEPGVVGLHQSARQGELGDLGLLRGHRWLNGVVDESDRDRELIGYLDLVIWLFGVQPNQVYAIRNELNTTLQVHLGFPGNGMAMLDFAWGLPATGNYDSLHVIGDRGAAYADDHRNMSLVYAREKLPQALRVDSADFALKTMLQEFVSEGATSKSLASVSEFLPAMRILEAIKTSAAERQSCVWERDQFVVTGGKA